MITKIVRLIAIALVFFPLTAKALPITYLFAVQATNGPLASNIALGGFSFDSGIVPAGGGVLEQANLFNDLSFTWNKVTYNTSSTKTGRLAFDNSGHLTEALFGSDCIPGWCGLSGSEESWFVDISSSHAVFEYADHGVTGSGVSVVFGPISFDSPPVDSPDSGVIISACTTACYYSVPEPANFALFALGIACMYMFRSANRKLY